MTIYIAFLRGINVSGHKKILMKELKLLFERLGHQDVITYIQSGNVVFKSHSKSSGRIADEIGEGIKQEFGYEVPVLVRTRFEIAGILKNSPYKNNEMLAENKVYYVLFKELPKKELLAEFAKATYVNEECMVIADCCYLLCHKGAGKARLNNNLIEQKLNITATTRNHNTLLKLLELAG